MQPDMRDSQGSAGPQRHNPVAGMGGRGKRRKISLVVRELRISAFIVIVGSALILAALALWFWSYNSSTNEMTQVNTNEYQAVFLTNGQVYFGKVGKLNHDYLTLSSIFYLQSASTSSSTSSPQPSSSNNLTLVKLGVNELHAPEDKMVINQAQVSFWENLKDSSKVVTAIKQYIANPSAANSSSQVQSGTGTTTK